MSKAAPDDGTLKEAGAVGLRRARKRVTVQQCEPQIVRSGRQLPASPSAVRLSPTNKEENAFGVILQHSIQCSRHSIINNVST
jgi:hypothetical protein